MPNLLDLRTLNGNPSSTKFDEFWEEIMFDNLQTAVHECITQYPISHLQLVLET